MTLGPHVSVEGLDKFRRDLRRLDSGAGKEIGKANKDAAEFVVDKAESQGRRLGGVHRHVVNAGSIRASARQRAATVLLGGAGGKHGPALGAEFGAKKFNQFPEWRGNQWSEGAAGGVGYMLHPAIRENLPEFEDIYIERLRSVARRYGLPIK